MNWKKLRKEFPATKNGAYLNSAAVGPIPKKVYEGYKTHLKMMRDHGDWNWRHTIVLRDQFREKLANWFKTETTHVGFGANTSHNMNMLALYFKTEKQQKVLCSSDEFPSTYLPWIYHGYEVVFVEPDESGQVTVEQYEEAAKEHCPVVVLCSIVQFASGFRIDLRKLSKSIRGMRSYLVVNATQSLGVFPFDFESFDCDILVGSVHKWLCAGYGQSLLCFNKKFKFEKELPMGGWLSVNHDQIMQPPPVAFRKDASSLETGVPPFSVIQAMDAAFEFSFEVGLENIAKRNCKLATEFAHRAQEQGLGILSYRDDKDWKESRNSGTILLDLNGGEELELELQKHNVFISARGKGMRVACHYFNNSEDFDELLGCLKKLKV